MKITIESTTKIVTLQERTVKHYLTQIMGALGARNRVEAALLFHGLPVGD